MHSNGPVAKKVNLTELPLTDDTKNVLEPPSRPLRDDFFSKISFSRDTLLKIKNSKKSWLDLDEKILLINSKVLSKILKPECKILERQSKAHDQGGIILGPQNRSWNAGCHVSQTKYVSQDSTFSKGQKESKFIRGKFKRDSKTFDRHTSRSNAASNIKFPGSAAYGKDNAVSKKCLIESLKDAEKEPEWFTDGPQTINDTIELGMVIEDSESKLEKPSHYEPDKPTQGPSKLDSAILSIAKEKSSPHSSVLDKADFLSFPEFPKINDECSRLRQFFASSGSDVSNAISTKNSSKDKSSSRLLKLLASPSDSFVPQNQIVRPSSPHPSTSELESALKALLIRNASAPTFKSLKIPSVSSEPSLVTAFPTVEEIEAAAFYGDGGIAPETKPTRPSVFLDQLASSWGLKQQSRPQSSSFGDSIRSTPPDRDLLEALRQRAKSFVFSELSHLENKMTNRNFPFTGDMFIDPSGDPPAPSRVHNRLLSRQANSPSHLLPNDPAIAFHYTSCRPFINGPSVAGPLITQHQQRAHSNQQPPCFSPSIHLCMPTLALRSNPGTEADLLQFKGSDIVQQDPATPPNSLYSSNATINNGSSNRLEHILFSASVAAVASTMSANGYCARPQLKQNGSAPSLMPPTWQPAAASQLSAADIIGRTGISNPLTSSDFELSAVHRKSS